jgi:hypothetical protein
VARTFLQLRRTLAVLTLVLSGADCYASHHYPPEPNTSLSDATGFTLRSGAEVLFAKPGATIANDTLFAVGTLGPLNVPTDSIADITTRGYSPWGSLVVIGAAAAASALGLVFLVLANGHGGT